MGDTTTKRIEKIADRIEADMEIALKEIEAIDPELGKHLRRYVTREGNTFRYNPISDFQKLVRTTVVDSKNVLRGLE